MFRTFTTASSFSIQHKRLDLVLIWRSIKYAHVWSIFLFFCCWQNIVWFEQLWVICSPENFFWVAIQFKWALRENGSVKNICTKPLRSCRWEDKNSLMKKKTYRVSQKKWVLLYWAFTEWISPLLWAAYLSKLVFGDFVQRLCRIKVRYWKILPRSNLLWLWFFGLQRGTQKSK